MTHHIGALKVEGGNMSAQELAQKALAYRDGNSMFARFDLQAALDHGRGCRCCKERWGGPTKATIRAAIKLLG
jgi:hypothetical protein